MEGLQARHWLGDGCTDDNDPVRQRSTSQMTVDPSVITESIVTCGETRVTNSNANGLNSQVDTTNQAATKTCLSAFLLFESCESERPTQRETVAR